MGDCRPKKVKSPPHRYVIATCAAAPDEEEGVSQNQCKPDRDYDERRSRSFFPSHGAPHNALHKHSEQYGCEYRDQKSDCKVYTQFRVRKEGDVCGERHKIAMREVHKVQRLVDHRQTDSGNGDDAADDETVDDQLHPLIMMDMDVYNVWRMSGACQRWYDLNHLAAASTSTANCAAQLILQLLEAFLDAFLLPFERACPKLHCLLLLVQFRFHGIAFTFD